MSDPNRRKPVPLIIGRHIGLGRAFRQNIADIRLQRAKNKSGMMVGDAISRGSRARRHHSRNRNRHKTGRNNTQTLRQHQIHRVFPQLNKDKWQNYVHRKIEPLKHYTSQSYRKLI